MVTVREAADGIVHLFKWIVEIAVTVVNSIELGTWAGSVNVTGFLIILGLVIMVRPFRFAAGIFSAFIAKMLGVDPTPFLPKPSSQTKDAITFTGIFIASMFIVWFIEFSDYRLHPR